MFGDFRNRFGPLLRGAAATLFQFDVGIAVAEVATMDGASEVVEDDDVGGAGLEEGRAARGWAWIVLGRCQEP